MKILFILSVVMAICLITILSINAFYSSDVQITAYYLENKPQDFFNALTNSDSVLLEAVSNPGNHFQINSLADTQVDELINQYKTINVEYQGKYYSLDVAMIDNASPLTILALPALIGLIISVLLFIIFAIRKTFGYLRKNRK